MTTGPCLKGGGEALSKPRIRERGGVCVFKAWLAALPLGAPRELCWAMREAPGPGYWALWDVTHPSVHTWLLVATPLPHRVCLASLTATVTG